MGSQDFAGAGAVVVHLRNQRLNAIELLFGAQTLDKAHPQASPALLHCSLHRPWDNNNNKDHIRVITVDRTRVLSQHKWFATPQVT